MEKKRKHELIILTILVLTPVLIVAAEFQFNWFEHMVGSYLESNNANRERLAKFIEQDTRSSEATKALERIITQKAAVVEDEQKVPESSGVVDIVRLDKNRRMIMTTDQFKALHRKVARSGRSIPQVKLAARMSWNDSWERSILTRPSWIQRGALYFVDAENTILSEAPLSAELYDLFDVYGMGTPEDSPFSQGKVRIFGPDRFFMALKRLPSTIRDQIVTPARLPSLESTARRVGLTAIKGRGKADLLIETSIQDHIEVTTLPIPGLIHKELISKLDGGAL
jgi:hypothetical protein